MNGQMEDLEGRIAELAARVSELEAAAAGAGEASGGFVEPEPPADFGAFGLTLDGDYVKASQKSQSLSFAADTKGLQIAGFDNPTSLNGITVRSLLGRSVLTLDSTPGGDLRLIARDKDGTGARVAYIPVTPSNEQEDERFTGSLDVLTGVTLSGSGLLFTSKTLAFEDGLLVSAEDGAGATVPVSECEEEE